MTKVLPAFCLLSMSLVAACSGAAAKVTAAPRPEEPAVASRGAAAAVVGVYELDKEAFARYLASQVTLTKGRELEGILILGALAHEIEWTFDLRADGSMERKRKLPIPDDAPMESAAGTWRLDGDKLTIQTEDSSGKEEKVTADYAGDAFSMELRKEGGEGVHGKLTFKRR